MAGVTLSDVAERCGLSRAAVSLVLQDSRRVSDATKARVRAAIKDMGYVYNRQAANLRMERSFTLGLVLTDIQNSALAALAMAVEAVADQAGCVLMMGYTGDSLERQTRILQAMIEYRLDGIVLSPASRSSAQDMLSLKQSGVPHVLVTRRIRNHSADYVGPDNVVAGQLLAAHLAEIGVQSVALLGGPVGVSARSEREKGLRSELPRHGIAWRPELSIPSHADSEGGAIALRQLLTTRPLPDALVGYNDAVVRGIFGELRRNGIAPGKDVAVVGFDNSPEAAHMHPELTSVDTFMARVGRTAGQQVLERVTEADKAITSVLVEPELHIRASTAAWTQATKRPAKQRAEPAVSA